MCDVAFGVQGVVFWVFVFLVRKRRGRFTSIMPAGFEPAIDIRRLRNTVVNFKVTRRSRDFARPDQTPLPSEYYS